MINFQHLKETIVSHVHNFRKPGKPAYQYRRSAEAPSSLAASCDAALILYSINELSSTDFRAWAAYINSFQDPETGWYRDRESEWVEPFRQDPWLFGLALRALNALNRQPAHPLSFLREWDTPEKMRRWIMSGKGIMHMAIIWFCSGRDFFPFDNFESTFFQILFENTDLFLPDRPAFQDALVRHESTPGNRILKDPFHNLFAWYAAGRELPDKELYIDWFLNEQNPDGLFFQNSTIATYAHMDGLQLLVAFSQTTDYRNEDCRKAVERGLNAVFSDNHFSSFWTPDCIHLMLASCETVTQALRLFPDHPLAEINWNPVWNLNMWKLNPTCFQ